MRWGKSIKHKKDGWDDGNLGYLPLEGSLYTELGLVHSVATVPQLFWLLIPILAAEVMSQVVFIIPQPCIFPAQALRV